MDFKDYLRLMVAKDASDLYLTVGAPPSAKFQGRLRPIERTPIAAGRVREIAYSVMSPEQVEQFETKPEMNLAITEKGLGRFRVNIFRQRNQVSMVVRNIKTQIPSMTALSMPPIMERLIMAKRGLVLFVGATGSGKSTSLASLINFRNETSADHIVTIEDPIEFLHAHKKSVVNQREVGIDTDSYEDALKNTLRQAPDVILIGEIRERETMEHAIAFAETGHLCLSTLHANNSNQALDRIINFFPDDRRQQLLLDLSLNLRSMISQRLIPTVDHQRIAAYEILLNSPLVAQLIKKGEVTEIKSTMERSENIGMQTFDRALFTLYRDGRISMEEALRNADSENNLRLAINMAEKQGDIGSADQFKLMEDEPREAEPRASRTSRLQLKLQD
jgi:twitching motility protein PilU